MNDQLYYDKTEGMYWRENEQGESLFYAWAGEVTEAEAESAIDKIAPRDE